MVLHRLPRGRTRPSSSVGRQGMVSSSGETGPETVSPESGGPGVWGWGAKGTVGVRRDKGELGPHREMDLDFP